MIAIVAHKDRMGAAWELADKVGAKNVTLDPGRLGAGENHLRAWRWLKENSEDEWSVLLEDDAIPVPNFSDQLQQALAAAPSPLVSLYLGRTRPPHAQDSIAQAVVRPECWLLGSLYHCVGVAVKTEKLRSMTHEVTHFLDHMPIDEALNMWSRMHRLQWAYAHPSLVDHDWELPSTITHRNTIYGTETVDRAIDPKHPRKAWLVGNREVWDSSTFRIPIPWAEQQVYHSLPETGVTLF